MTTVEIVSFGYGHDTPPDAHIIIDLRTHFKDPHVSPNLRTMTGRDPDVVHTVMNTPGIVQLIGSIVAQVHSFRAGPAGGSVAVAVGCVGGRHRSAVVAAQAALRLASDGVTVRLEHRDIDRPVISRPVKETAS